MTRTIVERIVITVSSALMLTTSAAAQQSIPAQLAKIQNDLQEIKTAVASGGTVGLKTPSDSIVAIPFLTECPKPGVPGRLVDTQLLADGTTGPFAIPPGSAFMVTGVEFAANSVPPGQRTGFVLTTTETGIVLVEGYAVNPGQAGLTSGSVLLSTPMRVTTGLCVNAGLNQEVPPARVRIRGFFVPNN